MTERVVTESIVRALAAEVGDDRPAALVVAGAPRWSGPETLDTEHGPVRVVPCVSTLALREALVTHRARADGELLVLVTDRDEREIGLEVLAGLWRPEVLRAHGWEACLRLFRAQRLDPKLAAERWLVDLLVGLAPAGGYPPAPMGVLDAATAWRTFLDHGLGLDDRPDLADLLAWAGSGHAAALGRFGDDDRRRITDRLAGTVGAGALAVLDLAADGRGGQAVAVGLVVGVLWDPAVEGHEAASARGWLHGSGLAGDLSADDARSWGQAAAGLVRRWLAEGEHDPARAAITGAEQLLARARAEPLVHASDVLPSAFDQRLARAGQALSAALDDPAAGLATLHEARARVAAHVRAAGGADPAAAQLDDACRLARRLAEEAPADPAGLADAALSYLAAGAWVDRARRSVAEGSTVPDLAKAYGRLLERVDAGRDVAQRRFGELLAESVRLPADPDGPLLPIEAVLDRVAAPLAEAAPLLVLVVDGMAHADASRILEDVRPLGWVDSEPEAAALPPVLAAIPTVTTVSRTSLLSGRLTRGGQADERSGFTSHRRLRAAAAPGEPVLFHKADLRAEEGRVAPEVREAITDPDRRVAGVVVNGVDDHLGKGSQLRLADGLEGIKPLRWLLEAALEANRVVVLASDHGHILDHGTQVTPGRRGGGERWCPADRDPGDDEVELAGPRVLLGDGRVIAPATDRTRYTNERKHGYHGGATPEEALCPLHVLIPASRALDGWVPAPLREPVWWQPAEARAAIRPPVQVRDVGPPRDADGTPTLFDTRDPEPPAAKQPRWIAELLASPVLDSQRRIAGRVALDDDELATLLAVLDAHGDVASPAALQRATDLRPHRLPGKLEALRTLLNVDAYPVVEVEPDRTVRLNRRLLAEQFELETRP